MKQKPQHDAATKLQAQFRGRIARKVVADKPLNDAATKLQSRWRGGRARSLGPKRAAENARKGAEVENARLARKRREREKRAKMKDNIPSFVEEDNEVVAKLKRASECVQAMETILKSGRGSLRKNEKMSRLCGEWRWIRIKTLLLGDGTAPLALSSLVGDHTPTFVSFLEARAAMPTLGATVLVSGEVGDRIEYQAARRRDALSFALLLEVFQNDLSCDFTRPRRTLLVNGRCKSDSGEAGQERVTWQRFKSGVP